ncbi:MAG TPA: YqgE/AlgH family protein [Gammaproteobacteria bacterium]|nr:YqgE/AlgH family protein [Gammaproteobacteria bacterium]
MNAVLKTRALVALSVLAAAGIAARASAQPLAPTPSLAPGRLLVATGDIEDDNFGKTVVLLLHHDENGTLGVIVNRPTWVKPHDVDPDFGNLEGYDGAVFRGGPLAAGQMIFLVRDPPDGAIDSPPIFDHVYAGGNPEQLPKLVKAAPDTKRLRLYAGHAEWAGGQLEREIADGQWTVVDGTPDRVFNMDPTTLWDRMSHQGSEVTVDARPGASAPEVGARPGAQPIATAAARGSFARSALR